MTDRPILMSAPMVRAILDGSKTQTRRVVKWKGLEPGINLQFSGLSVERSWNMFVLTSATRDSHEYRSEPQACPYGYIGDRLWVRETFYAWGRWETRFSEKKGRDEWHFIDLTLEAGKAYAYAADGLPAGFAKKHGAGRGGVMPTWWKRPAIFMPRAACRITLEVAGVRVERLQDISEADAKAEGVVWEQGQTAVNVFESLWESINGPGSWEANPWVWVVEFKRVPPLAQGPEERKQ